MDLELVVMTSNEHKITCNNLQWTLIDPDRTLIFYIDLQWSSNNLLMQQILLWHSHSHWVESHQVDPPEIPSLFSYDVYIDV